MARFLKICMTHTAKSPPKHRISFCKNWILGSPGYLGDLRKLSSTLANLDSRQKYGAYYLLPWYCIITILISLFSFLSLNFFLSCTVHTFFATAPQPPQQQPHHRTQSQLCTKPFCTKSVASKHSRAGDRVLCLPEELDAGQAAEVGLHRHGGRLADRDRVAQGRRHDPAGRDANRAQSSSHWRVHEHAGHLKLGHGPCRQLHLHGLQCGRRCSQIGRAHHQR